MKKVNRLKNSVTASSFGGLAALKLRLQAEAQAQQAIVHAQQIADAEKALALSALGVEVNSQLDEDDDAALFASAAKGSVQFVQTKYVPEFRRSLKVTEDVLSRRAAATGTEGASITGISDTQPLLNPVSSEAALSFKQKTLQNRIFDQLKAGQIRWYQAVDLHSCTIEQAREAVLQVIDMAQQENQTSLKIIHGKGQDATLKTCVNGWLRQHPDVMGFCSAPAEQGGTGAVLVLIKKSKVD